MPPIADATEIDVTNITVYIRCSRTLEGGHALKGDITFTVTSK